MKHPSKPEKWTNREIEADSAGYLAAQQTARENREQAEQRDRSQYAPEPDEAAQDEQARKHTRSEAMRVI
jgi:hypothetical protein